MEQESQQVQPVKKINKNLVIILSLVSVLLAGASFVALYTQAWNPGWNPFSEEENKTIFQEEDDEGIEKTTATEENCKILVEAPKKKDESYKDFFNTKTVIFEVKELNFSFAAPSLEGYFDDYGEYFVGNRESYVYLSYFEESTSEFDIFTPASEEIEIKLDNIFTFITVEDMGGIVDDFLYPDLIPLTPNEIDELIELHSTDGEPVSKEEILDIYGRSICLGRHKAISTHTTLGLGYYNIEFDVGNLRITARLSPISGMIDKTSKEYKSDYETILKILATLKIIN